MSDRKLRPRNKEINYLEIVSYKSPVNAVSRREFADRRPPVERNLRPRKVISYKDLDASPFQFDDDYGKYYPVAKEQKEKASTVLLAFEDDSDDDEYKSTRETNMKSRFDILKDMGIDNEKTVVMKICSKEKTTTRRRTQGSSSWTRRENFPVLRSKTRSTNPKDIVYTDMENENVMDVDEKKNKVGGSEATFNRSTFCENDYEDEYSVQRKKSMADRLNVLKNIDPNQTV